MKPAWYQKRELGLHKTGTLNIATLDIADLSPVDSLSCLRTLNLSYCPLTSLGSLKPQPRLHKLIADHSYLSEFNNFLAFPRLSVISLKATPLACKRNYELSLCILFGDNLSTVDGRLISQKVRRMAAEYPVSAKHLINRGWDAVYPCPEGDEYAKLCEMYDVQTEEAPARVPEPIPQSQPEGYLERIDAFLAQQRAQIQNAFERFGLPNIEA